MLLIVFLTACQNATLSETAKTLSVATPAVSVPYSSKAELDALPRRDDTISWKVARAFALMDLRAQYQNKYSWHGHRLSELPVVIYGPDSAPRYYEFFVLDPEGREVGTLTAPAKKGVTLGGTLYAFDWVRDYSPVQTKGASYRVFGSGYPSRVVVGVLGKDGEAPSQVVDASTNETVNLETETSQSTLDYIKSLDPARLADLGAADAADQADGMIEQSKVVQQQIKEFNDELEAAAEQIANTSDEDILAAVDQALATTETKGPWTEVRVENTHELPQYKGEIRKTLWYGWCGPSALAWAIRGLQTHYKGVYVPLASEASALNLWIPHLSGVTTKWAFPLGNSGSYALNLVEDGSGRVQSLNRVWVKEQSKAGDNGLYYTLAEDLKIFDSPVQGATMPWMFAFATLRATDLKYAVGFRVLSLHARGSLDRNMPVLALCGAGSSLHYKLAIGSQDQVLHYRDIIKIVVNLGWLGKYRTTINVDIPYWWNMYFLFTDNGATTGAHNFKPYWEYQAPVGAYLPLMPTVEWAALNAVNPVAWVELMCAAADQALGY